MHYTTGEILSVCGSHGSMHDFKIFKKSGGVLKSMLTLNEAIIDVKEG